MKTSTSNRVKAKSIESPRASGLMSHLWLSAVLIAITAITYHQSVNNRFTNWDDPLNVTANYEIRSLHGDSVGYTLNRLFTTTNHGMYAPLTMLSYAMQYNISKLNPRAYHTINLFLHLLNTLLVFAFIWLMFREQWVAFITALIFAIHPMHVESVAWVTGRIDLLYALFFLASLCTYAIYLKKGSRAFYFYTLLLFILSLLSKASAISLPLVLFAIDYFNERKFSWKMLLEKIPFLLLSLAFGVIAIYGTRSVNVFEEAVSYPLFDKFLFLCYAVVMYLWKFIIPADLSCVYYYPLKTDGWYPAFLYLSPFICAGLLFVVWRSLRYGKIVLFGLLFFILTIVLVLPLLQVRYVIIADRYTYLPYIGLALIVAAGISKLAQSNNARLKQFKLFAIGGIAIISILFCVLTFERCKVWFNGITLWDDAIEKNDTSYLSYKIRGEAYYESKQYDKVVADFSRSIALNPDNPAVHHNRGLAYCYLGKLDSGIYDFTVTLASQPHYLSALYNRGLAYLTKKQYGDAIKDFTAAVRVDPQYADALNNRGYCYSETGKYNEAINDYTAALRYNPGFATALFNRGKVYFILKRYEEALDDVLKAKALGHPVDPAIIETLRNEVRGRSSSGVQ